jgi:hypothetical protein
MYNIIFTLDYEIHGNGEGDPLELLIKSTERMLNLFNQYGARLTIMADVAEILKFKQYKEENGIDKFHYDLIIEQLQKAVKTGHDVQLHIHSSFYNAIYSDGSWKQDYTEYDLANQSLVRLESIIKEGKQFLEDILKKVDSNYRCIAFRAANWSMQPSRNIITALINNGIQIDTSVFKHGKRNGVVNFDEIFPWKTDCDDICKSDENGKLLEIPIFSEKRTVWAFLSLNRFYRVFISFKHKLGKNEIEVQNNSEKRSNNSSNKIINNLSIPFKKHAWKMDFNQCSGRQLVNALKRIEKKYGNHINDIPVVLIGHSKLFTTRNEINLNIFLDYVKNNEGKYCFSKFKL